MFRICVPLLLAASLQAQPPPGYVLTFHDEFDGSELNTKAWDTWIKGDDGSLMDARLHEPEASIYLDRNFKGSSGKPLGIDPFSVKDGILTITARRTPPELQRFVANKPFTSGVITTRRSFQQRYGYWEMRAQLPRGKGLWPAFWVVFRDIWPPEIDILEAFGATNGRRLPDGTREGAHDQAHFFLTSKDSGHSTAGGWFNVGADITAGFHTYGCEWEPDNVTFYFDGQPYVSYRPYGDFQVPMYAIVNLAVGGDWPGLPDDATVFPAEMKVDYVRVYQRQDPLSWREEHERINWRLWRPPAFKIGDRVQAAVEGTIVGGPVQSNGQTWWQVKLDGKSDGWIASADAVESPKFEIGDRVKSASQVEVISIPNASRKPDKPERTAAAGSTGVVFAGPVRSMGEIWWRVRFDGGPFGWVKSAALSEVPRFALQDAVRTALDAPVYSQPSPSGKPVAWIAEGAAGTVVGGPARNAGTSWYQVRFGSSPPAWINHVSLREIPGR